MADFGEYQCDTALEDTFVKIDMQDIKDYVDENGLENFTGYVDKKVDEWKEIPLNVGITGSSGVGKSTLINTLRDLKATDVGAAAVGVTETTTEPVPYSHPDNANLKLWDLPGMGTPKFPKASYLEDIRYDRFDFFLILSASRFTENDLYLAQELDKKQKRFIFVRSKVDVDLINEHDDHPNFTEAQVMDNIRANIMDNLDAGNIEERCRVIFLINCKKREKLEFEILLEYVIHNLPKIKKEVIVYSLRCLTKGMVKEKKELLRSRIWKASILAAGVAAVPVPGVALVCDFAILIAELKFYMRQLGIDENSLLILAREYGADFNFLKSKVANMAALISFTSITQETMVTFLRPLGISGAAVAVDKITDQLSYLIPVVGSVIASTVSFSTTYAILTKILKMAAEDAENVLDAAITYHARNMRQ